MAKKQTQQAPMPQPMAHHEQMAGEAHYGMSQQPTNEVGLQGHFANLNENFLVAGPYFPGEIAAPMPAKKR